MPPLSLEILLCLRSYSVEEEEENLFDPRWMDIITTRLETFQSARSFNSCTLRRSLMCTVNSFAIMRISDRDVNFTWKREEGKRITGNGPRHPSNFLGRKSNIMGSIKHGMPVVRWPSSAFCVLNCIVHHIDYWPTNWTTAIEIPSQFWMETPLHFGAQTWLKLHSDR